MVLVDANVLLDLVTAPNAWSDWSAAELRRAAAAGPLFANDVVFAEVSIGFLRIDDAEKVFAEAEVALSPYLARPCSGPERRSRSTAAGVAPGRACCRTSSSVPTPKRRGLAC